MEECMSPEMVQEPVLSAKVNTLSREGTYWIVTMEDGALNHLSVSRTN